MGWEVDVDDRFEGRVAVVTGSSMGIGLATARELAGGGAAVVLNARREAELGAAVDELVSAGARATGVVGDLTGPDTPARLVGAAMESFGRIDFLFNSVGLTGYVGRPFESDRDTFAATMLGNTWFAVELVGKAMKAGLATGGGSVVNISAISARKQIPVISQYDASQAALESLTRSLALDLGPDGVRVNAVQPGLVKTQGSAGIVEGREDVLAEMVPLRRLGSTEDIAAICCFLFSDAASWITGQVIAVDGGYTLASTNFMSVIEI
jgi:3-oxoacyl-[acyl-carrier protein] reductase